MAQDIVSGLFGLAPYQVAQQQQREIDTDAAKFAQMNAAQRGTMGLYQGGAGLAGMAGGMLGIQNPAMVEAQQRQAALQDLDISSPESILARAQQIQDPKLKMQLMMMADQKKKEAQTLAAQNMKMQLDEARAERERAMAERALRGEPEMKYAPEIQKLIAIRDAMPEGDPRRAMIEAAIRKATYIKPEGGSSGMTAGELRQQKYEDQKEKEAREKREAAQSGLDAFAAVKRNIEDLYDPTNNRLKPNATALFGRADQFRPATLLSEGSANALSSLNALKDQITMSNLADAKARVGQSFGSMQVQEWDKFVRLLASLDRSMGEEKAASNLKFILDFINTKAKVLETALGATKPPAGQNTFEAKSPDEVRSLYKSGQISREQAKAILKDMGV